MYNILSMIYEFLNSCRHATSLYECRYYQANASRTLLACEMSDLGVFENFFAK